MLSNGKYSRYLDNKDVTAMYTSIPGKDAVDIFCQKLINVNFAYFGLYPADFRDLLMMVLDNSYFKFEEMVFKQTSGLPMGNKVSGMLADSYMDSIERSLVNRLSINFYYRYVDDCLLLTTSREEADKIYHEFNTANSYIKFEIEHPGVDGSLSLLDFNINVNNEVPIVRAHTKPIKSDIFMSGLTALPSQVKKNIIINEWNRIKRRCGSMEEIKKSRKKFINKLKKNQHEWIPFLSLHNNTHDNTSHTQQDSPVFYLSIPFLNDETNTKIKRSLKELGYNIRISHRSPCLNQLINPQIYRPPTRNKKCNLNGCRVNNTDCFKSMVIYEAICSCSANYIGSTKKFFHIRMKEHFSQSSSNIFKHNRVCEGQWNFKIRQSFLSLQSLRWGEAILIKRERPQLNRREEGVCLQTYLA
jgi:hypothetical protein